MNFWDRLETIAARKDVLRHPFYVRWSEGTLTVADLADYAGQYRHAVVALADAAASAARSPEAGPELAEHAAEEAEHIALWDEFVAQVGGDAKAEPNRHTRACVRAWAGEEDRPLLQTLVAMYAIESAQPAISRTKQTGLAAHYGIAGSPYFELHQTLDVAHASELRDAIEERFHDSDEEELLRTAERVLEGNWLLLDGVDRA